MKSTARNEQPEAWSLADSVFVSLGIVYAALTVLQWTNLVEIDQESMPDWANVLLDVFVALFLGSGLVSAVRAFRRRRTADKSQ